MKLISSVLLFLMVPLSSHAMNGVPGSSSTTLGGGGYGGGYGGPSYHDQNAAIVRRMEAQARARDQARAKAQREESRRAQAERDRVASAERERVAAVERARVEAERVRLIEVARLENLARLQREREDRARNGQRARENFDQRRARESLDRRNALNPERVQLLNQTEQKRVETNRVITESFNRYSQVTKTIGKEASTFVRDQLGNAGSLADDASTAAEFPNTSAPMIKLYSDLAVDTANSVNRFLGAAADGVYDRFVSLAEVSAAVLQDPTLMLNLSNNIIYAISESPIQVVNHLYHDMTGALTHFNHSMLYGDAEQRGRALGHLAGDVLIGLAAEEVVGGRASLKRYGESLNRVPSEPLGEVIYQELRNNTTTAPLMEASNQRLMQEIGEAFERNLGRCIEIRDTYNRELPGIRATGERMLADGQSVETVARHVSQLRLELATRMKEITPEEITPHLYNRNIRRYGNPYGPTIEYLRDVKHKSWEEIIEGASRSNAEINAMIEAAQQRRGQ